MYSHVLIGLILPFPEPCLKRPLVFLWQGEDYFWLEIFVLSTRFRCLLNFHGCVEVYSYIYDISFTPSTPSHNHRTLILLNLNVTALILCTVWGRAKMNNSHFISGRLGRPYILITLSINSGSYSIWYSNPNWYACFIGMLNFSGSLGQSLHLTFS